MNVNTNHDLFTRIAIVGDVGVGKTSIMMRQYNNSFSQFCAVTIGIDFRHSIVAVQDKKIKIQMWEISGSLKYSFSIPQMRNFDNILVIFDVTDRHSFKNIINWIAEIKECDRYKTDKNIIIIGNKCDLRNRAVTFEEAKIFAKDHDAMYIETSAKSNIGIHEIFNTLAEKTLERPKDPPKNILAEPPRDPCWLWKKITEIIQYVCTVFCK
jgi:small GTP-binding protein